MKAILLSGYRADLGPQLISQRIVELQSLGFSVICVLAGAHADDLLRACPQISGIELVFDTHKQPNLATNIKAGLAATEEGCFVLPVEVPPPPAHLWHFLKHEWSRLGFHIEDPLLQVVDTVGAPCHLGFPLVITRKGNQLIQGLADFHSLIDERLPIRPCTLAEGRLD